MLRIITVCLLLAGPSSAVRLNTLLKTSEERQVDEALETLAEKTSMEAQGKLPEVTVETHEQVAPPVKRNCGVVFVHGIGTYHPDESYGPLLNKYINCKQFAYPVSHLHQVISDRKVPVWYHVERDWGLSPFFKPPHYGSNMTDVEANIPKIHKAIDSIVEAGIPPANIFVGGHSQGSTMAAAGGLSYPQKIGGVFMVSGAVDGDVNTNKKFTSPANKKTPIHWQHSENDNVMMYGFMQVGAPAMRKLGHPVETVTYNKDHYKLDKFNFHRIDKFIKRLTTSADSHAV